MTHWMLLRRIHHWVETRCRNFPPQNVRFSDSDEQLTTGDYKRDSSHTCSRDWYRSRTFSQISWHRMPSMHGPRSSTGHPKKSSLKPTLTKKFSRGSKKIRPASPILVGNCARERMKRYCTQKQFLWQYGLRCRWNVLTDWPFLLHCLNILIEFSSSGARGRGLVGQGGMGSWWGFVERMEQNCVGDMG